MTLYLVLTSHYVLTFKLVLISTSYLFISAFRYFLFPSELICEISILLLELQVLLFLVLLLLVSSLVIILGFRFGFGFWFQFWFRFSNFRFLTTMYQHVRISHPLAFQSYPILSFPSLVPPHPPDPN